MYRRRIRIKTRPLVMSLANLAVTVVIIGPLLFTFLASLQTEKSLVEDYMRLIPTKLTTQNFQVILFGNSDILKDTGFYHLPKVVFQFPLAFRNSLLIALVTTILNLSIGSMAAYAIARLPVRWTRGFMYANLASRMVPLMVLMIPLFISLRQLRLQNSLSGIIIALTGFLLPYTIWILYAFFASLPHELEDAARVDGCSRFGTFIRVVLPLSAPGIAAAGAIVFILSWNEFFIPFVVNTRPEAMPVPVLIASLVGDWRVYYTLVAACIILGLLPSVALALLLQRYIVSGLTAGALKG